ncbi:MAG: hypothetical protein PWP65_2037 [Clostridia bacterium]|nr:hypothetical protein [Clostridia bacterium]
MPEGEKRGINWAPLWKEEDWWAVWFGFILIILVAIGWITKVPKIGKWSTSLGQAIPASNLFPLLLLLIGIGILTAIGIKAMGLDVRKYLLAFPVVFILAVIAMLIGGHALAKAYNLEVPLWALIVGLLVSNTVGTPQWLQPAVRTEMYIKTGLVLLGCEILFHRIVALGPPGLMVAWIVTPIVLIFMYWFGVRILKIESKEFALTLSAATSVCGVSAAIATGAACRAKKEEVSMAIGLSLLFTVIMLVLFPFIVKASGMDVDVGAAWIGGTIDSTGAVVAAGAMLGDRGLQIASVVKMIQNVLIGIIAFVVAVIWVWKVDRDPNAPRPSAMEIWIRFPKFVIGFVLASIIFSFIFVPGFGEKAVGAMTGSTKALRGWFFALAFVSIGLSSNFKEMAKYLKGGKPVWQYIIGQGFNVILTFIVAWIAFSGHYLPKP